MLILQMRKMKTERLNGLLSHPRANEWVSDALEFPMIPCSVLGEIFKLWPDLSQPEKFEQCPSLWAGERLDQSLGP